MAAGLGFKDFVTGEVLTAADVDGYLMQGTWVFANAAARTAAVTSPQEGNMSYLKDTNSTEYYSGSAWVAVGAAGGGMTLLSTTTLSGTSTTVSSIVSGYNDLYIVCEDVKGSGFDSAFLRFNGLTSSSIYYGGLTYHGAVNGSINSTGGGKNWTAAGKIILTDSSLNSAAMKMIIYIPNYLSTNNPQNIQISYYDRYNGLYAFGGAGIQTIAAAINSFTIGSDGGSVTLTGTVRIYGVK